MDLNSFFASCPRAALAFSGGTDSAYVLYAGLSCGADILPYYVKTPIQPRFELKDALSLCRGLNVPLKVIELDVLACPSVRDNPTDRCYHCKTLLLSAIASAAREDACSVILDGTNASDAEADRPGMRALAERGVLSPLRICGLTKAEIRRRSRDAGLFTWNKPAYACLATRIRSGERITAEKLRAVEESEEYLFSLGFTDFRVRTSDGNALLQFTEDQLADAFGREAQIRTRLSRFFHEIRINPKGRINSI